MLRDAGATSVILGHSERRQGHHETDAIVAAKAKAAWRHGQETIVCIGETQAPRWRSAEGLGRPTCGLPDMPAGSRTSIAYEPLWAIGSGTMPTRDQIVEVLAHLRAALQTRFGSAARLIRILYGGSVRPRSVRAILDTPDVDGVLIGGASLLAKDFDAIVDVARGRTPTIAPE